MTLKTSFFNKGIYESTVKRHMWGAILYAIILFFSTGLSLLLESEILRFGINNNALILQPSYFIFPLLMTLIIPTITARLVFSFLYLKKQSIFIHSLPPTRKAVFNSSLLAGLTLMLIPVILNGIILIIMSFCGYGNYFTVLDCLKWVGYNVMGLFMMFSCAVLAVTLTGNGFAALVVNGLIHGFLFMAVSAFSFMADAYVYGFTEMNSVVDVFAENNFIARIVGFVNQFAREELKVWDFAEYIVISLILYGLSYCLYKKRRMETVGDVAGFKCLNPIFKYTVTFFVTMSVFSMYWGANPYVFAVILTGISAVAYAVSEMILKKTMNVLYSWKGFVGYAVVFSGIVILFSQTTFFGYETRLPEISDMEGAALYEYYTEEIPFSDDDEVTEIILSTHKEFIDGYIPRTKKGEEYTTINIEYKLKNGEIMSREYPVSYESRNMVMDKLYEYDKYKIMSEEIFVDDSVITGVYINDGEKMENYAGFIEALRSDVMAMSYSELHPSYYNDDEVLYNVSVEYEVKANPADENSEKYIRCVYIDVTKNYKNTMNWLIEKMAKGEVPESEILLKD